MGRVHVAMSLLKTEPALQRGDSVYLVGLSRNLQATSRKSIVTNPCAALNIGSADSPRYRATNMEVIELDTGEEFKSFHIKFSYYKLVRNSLCFLLVSLQILVAHFQERWLMSKGGFGPFGEAFRLRFIFPLCNSLNFCVFILFSNIMLSCELNTD